jgi:hypothetical protein
MNKNLISAITILFSVAFGYAQIDINDARTNFSIGQTVTIIGVSSDGGELGPIRYIQDETGGLPVYGGASVNGINRGDSVAVTGELKDFNGLLEIDPISNVTAFGTGTEIDAWNISITDMGETFEGRLLQFDNVTFPDAGGTFSGATNYNFTDGTNTGEFRVQNGSDLVGTTIPSGPQSLVGLGSEFNGTYQVLPRDLNDIFPYVAPDRKIIVEVDGVNFLNSSTAFIGTTVNTPITVKNIGINNLTISDVTITGAEAGDFSTDIAPGIIGGAGETNNTLTFSVGGIGSRQAAIEITSDDPDDPIFIINIYAIGNDNLATEPIDGPSSLDFTNISAYSLNASFTPATAAEEYIVLWRKGSAPTGTPVDGQTYLRGDIIGDSKVAYVGSSSSFTPRAIRANTDYYFTAYAYNGYGNYVNYNTSDIASNNVSSTGEEIGNYYNGINSNSPTFLDDLTALINPHDFSSYFLYKTIVMDQFEIQDTIAGQSFVTCAYSGERLVFSGPFDWTATGYSREHTYAHSWMPTFPANGNPNELEYVDYHNLYPTNLSQANTPRSNLPFGEIVGDVVFNYLDGSVGELSDGSLVYEPRDEQKGNLSRAIFYMATCYNGANGTGDDWRIPSNQNQEVLKNWHFNDLPDNYEIARHELIYGVQNNRNPFIDSVDFACYIDFSQMLYTTDDCGLAVDQEVLERNLVVYPNPANEEVYVQVNGVDIEKITITDMSGKTVKIIDDHGTGKINVSNINSGIYILSVETSHGFMQRKLVLK